MKYDAPEENQPISIIDNKLCYESMIYNVRLVTLVQKYIIKEDFLSASCVPVLGKFYYRSYLREAEQKKVPSHCINF